MGRFGVVAVGAAEAAIFGVRRWLVARPLAEVEASMREALYYHVQRLPISFHDRWSSGQLLSRATSDLGLIHVFLVLPLTFLVVNATTILVGCLILLSQQWTLGLVLLAPAVPLMVVSSFFEARYALASRQAQDHSGNLTTVIEESVMGIRVIKGFGRMRARLTRSGSWPAGSPWCRASQGSPAGWRVSPVRGVTGDRGRGDACWGPTRWPMGRYRWVPCWRPWRRPWSCGRWWSRRARCSP
ncbi:ABC transporter transmembrane domain-containing protein [Actinopolymorpha pittospori]|uniref:ABC transporter transmembrane domain-containing protein n=1 Tax=Actinopolymorpha pittospori TaxID=648752 RepID=UPI00192D932B